MRFRVLFAIVGLLGAALAPRAASAQDVLDRVRLEIERTDRRIERAQILVSESTNEQARAELGEAVRIQANAKVELAASHPRIALDLTFSARAHADRAIALINGLPDPDRVLAQLERTRELIERARQRIEECDQDRARAMIRTAFDMQQRAEEAGRAGHYLAALQLTMGARERAHKALRLCNIAENVRESADRALRRTDEVIQRAQDQVGDGAPEAAKQLLARAMETQARAQQEFRDEHFEPSLRLTLSARAFAFRAVRLTGGLR